MHISESDKKFNDAVEFAKKEGYPVETGPGCYLDWKLNDRERALLTLLGKELTNHRGIRIAIHNPNNMKSENQ